MRYPDSRRAIAKKRRRRLGLVCAQSEAVGRAGDQLGVACGIERASADVRSDAEGIRTGVSHFQLRVLSIFKANYANEMFAPG